MGFVFKHILNEMSSDTSLFSVCPAKNFSRDRIFTFKNTVLCILGMAGNSLNKELFDINALYDLLSRIYLDCVIQPKLKSNKSSACCEMINRQTFRKSILTADRDVVS